MSNFDTVIDFGSQNLRLGVYDQSSKIIYSSNIKITEVLESKNLDESLNNLIRDAEKKLSTHIVDVNVLYDTSKFNFIDISIKKYFDQPALISKYYKSLVEEAKFIISENNFKDQVVHIVINNMIVDENRKLETIIEDIKIKSLILDLKFICLKKSLINNLSNKFKQNNLNILNIYCSSYVKSIFYKKNIATKNKFIFLDIGYQRTSALFFNNNKFQFFNSVPIGGNNITNDISKVLKLDVNYSEDLKIKFNKEETETYFKKTNPYIEIFENNISIDLLKQIIEARVEEIMEIVVFKSNYIKNLKTSLKPKLVITGGGSQLFSNSHNTAIKKLISELKIIDENDTSIYEIGIDYHKSDESFLNNTKKRTRKMGFFESFFNMFSK